MLAAVQGQHRECNEVSQQRGSKRKTQMQTGMTEASWPVPSRENQPVSGTRLLWQERVWDLTVLCSASSGEPHMLAEKSEV